MIVDEIKKLVKDSNLDKMQKRIAVGFLDRATDNDGRNESDRLLIRQVAQEKHLSDIIFSSDLVKIYSVYGKSDWDIKYPIRFIYVDKNNNWVRCITVAPDMETAYLIYLEHRYIGSNSQFSYFAMKMLGINQQNQ